MSNRLSAIKDAVIPTNIYESIIYEAVSDLFVTTAGTGLSKVGIKDVGCANFFVGGAGEYARGCYFDTVAATRNGLSVQYRNHVLNSERLRLNKPQSFKGSPYDSVNDSNRDLVMHFVPAPPGQYGGANTFGSYVMGTGPGDMSDYEHSSIGNIMSSGATIAFPTLFKANQYGIGPAQLVRIPHQTGYVTRKYPQFNLGGSAGLGPIFDPDLVDNPCSYTVSSIIDFYAGETLDPKPGKEVIRVANGATMASFENRVLNWDHMVPESVGRPFGDALFRLQGQGSQGLHTARLPTMQGFEFIQITPSENLLQPCTIDAAYKNKFGEAEEFLPSTELQPILLSQSALPLMHQELGNISFPNQGYFFGQMTPVVYPAIVGPHEFTLSLQKLWAFKGNVVNKDGKCWLLINAGYGGGIQRDWELINAQYANVYPHTGYSADVFHLLYRPVKSK